MPEIIQLSFQLGSKWVSFACRFTVSDKLGVIQTGAERNREKTS